MNFSYPIKFSGIVSYSPNGKYLAISKMAEVIIYETQELKIYHKFTFCDLPNKIEWSPDSTLLLVGLFKRGICEVKAIDSAEWVCKIDEGLAGMSYARFSPDSRRVLTISEFNVRLTVWSLIDRSTCYISYPKFADKGLSYTSNGYFMALAERKDTKDYVGIYYVGDWTLVSHFAVDTFDLQDLMWSKDNTAIIVWDSVLECKFCIYSPTGNLIMTHTPYDMNLGIKSVNMSPNGHYLSVGYYDQAVRLYNHISWKMIIDLQHTQTISETSNINIFKEEESEEETYSGDRKKITKYVPIQGPIKLNILKPSLDKPNPQIGVSEMSWSFDSNFLATRNDNMPNTIWIWQINTLTLHTVIINIKSIKSFSWSPSEHMLLICAENSKLYTFTLSNVYIVDLVTDINFNLGITKIQWNIDGKSFVATDKNHMILGHPEISDEYVPTEQQEGEEEYEEQNNENNNSYEN